MIFKIFKNRFIKNTKNMIDNNTDDTNEKEADYKKICLDMIDRTAMIHFANADQYSGKMEFCRLSDIYIPLFIFEYDQISRSQGKICKFEQLSDYERCCFDNANIIKNIMSEISYTMYETFRFEGECIKIYVAENTKGRYIYSFIRQTYAESNGRPVSSVSEYVWYIDKDIDLNTIDEQMIKNHIRYYQGFVNNEKAKEIRSPLYIVNYKCAVSF